MKIILIGAGGFLGQSLLHQLYNKNDEWHLLSSSLDGKSVGKKVICHRYEWPKQSLADAAFASLFKSADVIIYAAGAGIQPAETVDDQKIMQLNLEEPLRLVARLSEQRYRGQLISFGSYFEAGLDQPTEPLSETNFLALANPLPNTYCRAKKVLSHFHAAQFQAGLSFRWLHLVLTNIYGPGENSNRLIPYIMQQAKQGLDLHLTSGTQVRQYTFIGDVVAAVAHLLGKAEGFYHLTNPETLTVKSVIEETVRQVRSRWDLSPNLSFDLAQRRDTGMNYLAVCGDKLREEWGISCTTSIEDGIAQYFAK